MSLKCQGCNESVPYGVTARVLAGGTGMILAFIFPNAKAVESLSPAVTEGCGLSRRGVAKEEALPWENRPKKDDSLDLLLHPNPIEVRAEIGSTSIREGCRSRLPLDVALNDREGGLHRKVRAALEKIGSVGHALPTHRNPGHIIGWNQHHQNRSGVGRVGSGNPLLPIVHVIAVSVDEIR